jgi:hypothetical protein
MALITNHMLISFIEKNIKIFEKIGNIDLNIYQTETKIINNKICFDGELFIYFEKLKYYKYNDNIQHIIINNKKHNVSLISSILYCLYLNYTNMIDENKEKFIKKLIEKMASEVYIKFTEFEFSKMKWKKNDIVENINNNIYDYKVLKYLSDYFVINIFIIKNNKLYFCGGNNFIQFRKNIFVELKDEIYNPIFSEYKKVFSLSDVVIQNIINNLDTINLYFSDLPLTIYIEPLFKIKKNVKFDDVKTDGAKVDKKVIEYTDTLNGFDDADTECELSIDLIEDSPITIDTTDNLKVTGDKQLIKKHTGEKSYFKKHSVKELRDIATGCDIDIYKSCGKKLKTKQELLDEMFE